MIRTFDRTHYHWCRALHSELPVAIGVVSNKFPVVANSRAGLRIKIRYRMPCAIFFMRSVLKIKCILNTPYLHLNAMVSLRTKF